MTSDTNEERIYGPPGTGKTTSMGARIVDAAKEYGSDRVLVASFTKAAAVELAGRNLPLDSSQVGTLHAICYRALGNPTIAETRMSEWNDEYPSLRMTSTASGNDDPSWDMSMRSDADRLMATYQTLRARMLPIESANDGELTDFAKKWEDWKRESGYIDFTDMIELALQNFDSAPGDPSIMFLDEAQDMAPLELSLARRWSRQMDKFVMAGDDDQCQPSGTMVMTPNGEKKIEDLDPDSDVVVSIDRCGSYVVKSGYPFKKAARPYDGDIAEVSAGGKSAKSTLDHLWFVRWNKRAVKDAHVVYLMRKGEKFRVGWCKLFLSNASTFHLGARTRLEGADEAWVLYVADGRTDASVMESYVAAHYGLPTATFRGVNGAQHMTQESMDRLFAMFDANVMRLRADRCLRAFGRDIRYPIWERDKTHRGGMSNFVVRACNLLDGLMQVPLPDDRLRSYAWHDAAVVRNRYTGTVYSLAVEKSPYYIADGIITHNCLYSFKGSDPKSLFSTPAKVESVLAQSYRIPRAVHAAATRLTDQLSWRIKKEYRPRDADGFVKQLLGTDFGKPAAAVEKAKQLVSDGKTVMFLASCSYMLKQTCEALKEAGVAYHNPYKTKRQDWNPLAVGTAARRTALDRVIAYLAIRPDVRGTDAHIWNSDEFKLWASCIDAAKFFRRGVKTQITSKDFRLPSGDAERVSAIANMLSAATAELPDDDHFSNAFDGDLAWLERNLRGDQGQRMRYPVSIARTYGPKALLARPQVVVGTVHSVKGGEADVVFVYPDVSFAGKDEYDHVGPRRDSVLRLYYVGMTRAREGVYIMENSTANYVPLWSEE